MLRIAFMGSPAFSVPILNALHEKEHEIVAVYSQPPRPAGRRGLSLTPCPVHARALELELPVYTPPNFKQQEERDFFASLSIDVAIIVAYGLLLPPAILEAPRLGCYNLHTSLLPRWRGAAPIQRAIMAGDAETGIMVMKMDEGLDTGPILMQKKHAIAQETTAGELHDILAKEGAELICQSLELLEEGQVLLTPQKEIGACYAAKISKEEARIDWKEPAHSIQKKICGLSPFPGAWCMMRLNGKEERVKLLKAKLSEEMGGQAGHIVPQSLKIAGGDGRYIEITHLQRGGAKAMFAHEFLRGAPIEAVF